MVDKIPVAYNVGHLPWRTATPRNPTGKYLIALNKLSHGRHVSVGPSIPESSQLIDISGEKMKLLYDAFTEAEPHYAHDDAGGPGEADRGLHEGGQRNPNAIWDQKDAGVVQAAAGHVTVKMVAVRSTFYPQRSR